MNTSLAPTTRPISHNTTAHGVSSHHRSAAAQQQQQQQSYRHSDYGGTAYADGRESRHAFRTTPSSRMLTRSQAVPAKKASSCCGCCGFGSSSKGNSKSAAKEQYSGSSVMAKSSVGRSERAPDDAAARGRSGDGAAGDVPTKWRRSRTSTCSQHEDRDRDCLL